MDLRQSVIFMLLISVARADVIAMNLEEQSNEANPADSEDVVELFDPVLRLNRFSFHKSVLQERGSEVAHWVVIFCPNWYEPCQALQPLYRELSEQWQGRLNNALLSAEVRFASVDCATEKELCNTQNVGMNYPYVAHYKEQQKVSQWKGKSYQSDEERLKQWLQKQLGDIDSTMRIALDAEATAAESNFNVPVDFLLICVAILGNAIFIGRGGFGAETSMTSKSKDNSLGEGIDQVHLGSNADAAISHASCRARSESRASIEL